MSPISRRLTAAALSAALLATAACGSSDSHGDSPRGPVQIGQAVPGSALPACAMPGQGPVVLALGLHRNNPNPLAAEDVDVLVDHAVETGSLIGVVVIDGDPKLIGTDTFVPEAENPERLKIEKANFKSRLKNNILAAGPDDPESDPLRGISVAARTAQGGTILVSDSLLGTHGAIDFTVAGMLAAQPEEVVEYLKKTGQLPDLAGAAVILTGAGDLMAPQAPLPDSVRSNVISIWAATISASGASCLSILPRPNNVAPEDTASYPQVSLVAMPQTPVFEGLVSEDPTTAPVVPSSAEANPTSPVKPGPRPTPPSVTLFDDSTYGFNIGSADLRDPDAARNGLGQLASWLTNNPARTVTITGCTAGWGDHDYRVGLSQERARAIKSLLVELGVPEKRLTATGRGSDCPGYVVDQDSEGNLLPGPASQNRKVILTVR